MARRIVLSCGILCAAVCFLAAGASAQVIDENTGYLGSLSKADDRLGPSAAPHRIGDVQGLVAPELLDGWDAFRQAHSGDWVGYVDGRTGRLDFAEGAGIPWIPGRGNSLTRDDVLPFLGPSGEIDLAAMEAIARDFLPQVAGMLGVDPDALVLAEGRSGLYGGYLWLVDFDVQVNGLTVEGARVVFRVNHGNLIQLGSENLPLVGAGAPAKHISRDEARRALAEHIGGIKGPDYFIDPGTLKLLPARIDDVRQPDGYEFGNGRDVLAVWELVFRRKQESGTWRGRVDAVTGEVIEFYDINHYGQVTGGSVIGTATSETVVPMPFADVGGGAFANTAGIFSTGTSSALNGQYVRSLDSCGSINQAVSGGNIAFGTSPGSDCSNPGHGGNGNTRSSRTQFYNLNRAKEVARGWLPTNTWLNAKLTANVNLNQTCNAYWNGSTVNFFRSGGGCGNTGEIPGVSLHEYGHGLDSNDGNGSSPDNGTGETYGDFTAALATHASCIGSGFLGSNCGGYGDACTSCTGVRDIDFAKHSSGTAHTVANFTQPNCPTSFSYRGPCLREGHCESYISSEALWDLAARDLPNPGSGAAWSIVDRLWYLSRSTATGAFNCSTGGTYTSNGCSTGTLWRVFRAVDDDDGNLNNGTPHGGALFAAFNRHGIACTTDAGAGVTFAGCTAPSVPTLSLTGGSNQVTVAWSGSSGVYDVYRNELGCNAGFTKVANDVGSSPLIDTGVANGFTYYYQVVAHPSGNEACAAAPSSCQSVTPASGPCTPPSAPTGLSATAAGQTQVNLSWTASAGATSYNVYRGTTSGGPYTQIASGITGTSYSDTGASCNTTYYYVVRAATSCESGNSNQASATTAACTGCTTATLYSNNFESGAGLSDWGRGAFGGSGSVSSWRGIQSCTAASGSKIFRYGGSNCSRNYSSNNFNFAEPQTATGISVPSGSSATTLTFNHRRQFETGYDGGTLAVSLDGFNYTLVPASAITGAGYNGTVSAACPPSGAAGIPIYTGTQSSFVGTTVDVDAVCNAITGGSGGCAGQTVWIAFTSITDCSITRDGWFLDDVVVTACTP